MKIQYSVKTWSYSLSEVQWTLLFDIIDNKEWSKEIIDYHNEEHGLWKTSKGLTLPELADSQMKRLLDELVEDTFFNQNAKVEYCSNILQITLVI